MYIQSESGQPFFLRMNERLYSSAPSGYLILPKLRDSTYQFAIGFPGNKWPDQSFAVTIDKKDQGYLLKNFEEKGWGLFNLQTLAVQMAASGAVKKESAKGVENKEATEFTNILSKAADDPSLKEKPVTEKPKEPAPVTVTAPVPAENKNVTVKDEPKQPAPVPEPVKEIIAAPPAKDSVLTAQVIPEKKPEPVKEEPKTVVPPPVEKEMAVVTAATDTVRKEPVPVIPVVTDAKEKEAVNEPVQPVKEEKPVEYKPAVVTKKAESSTTEGFGLTFTDQYEGQSDTIRILIPHPKPVVAPVVTPKEEPKEEPKFLEPVKEKEDSLSQKLEKVAAVKTVSNQCPSVADDNDFLKLRKRMAAETTDDGMITEAKKVLKTKCFTTTQIKNLGMLFLNDEGKYRFFDAAYPYAADPGNYPSLETELKDTYYINRFKAMLRS